MDLLKETEYVPDQWDSIFESMDSEEDQKQEQIRQKEQERKEQIQHMSREILDRLEDILSKGPRHEMASEIKKLFRKGKEGFSKGDPKIFAQRPDYVKDRNFITEFKKYCEQYDIDKVSYKQFLKLVYPGDGSQTVIDMREYLQKKQILAPYRPLKKMNWPLAIVLMILLYGLLVTDIGPLYALVPTALVGIHWFLYRLLHHRYGGPGTHMRLSFVALIIMFIFRDIVLQNTSEPGTFFMVHSVYFDLLFITFTMWLGEVSAKNNARMKEKKKQKQ